MDDLKIIKIEETYLKSIVELHKVAFKDYPSTRLGDLYIKKMFNWFISNNEATNFCALLGEKVVGYVVGAPENYKRSLNRYIFIPALISILKNLNLLFDIKIIKKIFLRLKDLIIKKNKKNLLIDRSFILVGIGIQEEYYGKGVGKRLMEKFEKEVKKRDYDSIKLSVFSDNIRAIKFYEKMKYVKIYEGKDYMVFYKKLDDYEK